jgi:hypothetical protein
MVGFCVKDIFVIAPSRMVVSRTLGRPEIKGLRTKEGVWCGQQWKELPAT